MKAITCKAASLSALLLAACACVPSSEPPVAETSSPQPVAAPAPAPTPTQAPAATIAPPQYENYLDAPQTTGTWTYGADPDETLAFFAQRGTENAAPFIIRCGVAQREVWLGRRGVSTSALMRITTETTQRTLTAEPVPGQRDLVAVRLRSSDPLLDAMAITKGRFAVETAGLPTLYLPAWAEVTRVIEDCR